ncbi:uncharacterized protein HMPREF1541_04520 [Cyphellophora europaea CBS 101466]|uniref:N-acetyltransferase domain-containing protein n=1 Tax=Cyphellophora europaea (strain CBS 101466) TaxID=1220924 RepID=W2RX19_CYPE1|nr:uncharacterized protein HMPREF1541_04520 [Cyphellophora europaea CBS 101466]ETN40244.1 hypothetical protein HMPREF1541_04520 [Cyphellophora europaea CBS 101466]
MTQATLLNYFKKAPSSASPAVLEHPPISTLSPSDVSPSLSNEPEPIVSVDALHSSNSSAVEADLQVAVETHVPTRTPIPNISHAAISRVVAEHLEPLKRLTSTILPVRYPDKFYNAVLLETEVSDLTRVVLYHDKPVGWIRCRLESPSPESAVKQIYIQALCILAPYRERGLASHLLKSILEPRILRQYHVNSIYAHVWESNEDALDWYKRRGFKQIMLVGQYYKRLNPSGAWIVRRDISVLDHVAPGG